MKMPKKITDKQRLDWLEAQNAKAKGGGKCLFRWSSSGRGWRLHEASLNESFYFGITLSNTVRDAIDKAIKEVKDV